MKHKHLILLVEDNPDDEVLTRRAFKKSGLAHDLAVARDGVEAIEMLHGAEGGPEGGLQPSLILLDLKLPRMDGLEVLRRIRGSDRTRHIPVVVLTTSSEESDIVSSYRLGTNSYLRKPVDFDQFFDAVKQLGTYWFDLNELPSQFSQDTK